jgi:hypothetical protein
MRKLWLPLGWTLANLALQLSGYQNPTLAGILLVGGVMAWVWWVISHETLLTWCRRRKKMTLWLAMAIGAVVGAGTGSAWWAWKIRPPKETSATSPPPEQAADLPKIQLSRDILPLGISIKPGEEANILTLRADRKFVFQNFTNDQKTLYSWPPLTSPEVKKKPDFMFRYQLINQSKSPIYNLQVPFTVEWGSSEKGWKAVVKENLPLETSWLIPATPFVFYAVNQSRDHIMITEPDSIRGQLEGESYLRSIPLGKLIRNPIDAVPMTLIPTNNNWSGNAIGP